MQRALDLDAIHRDAHKGGGLRVLRGTSATPSPAGVVRLIALCSRNDLKCAWGAGPKPCVLSGGSAP
jgi:hypothetical protein